jgi:hypothetical protein
LIFLFKLPPVIYSSTVTTARERSVRVRVGVA